MLELSFFEKYSEMEALWQNFLAKTILYRNSSALGMTAMRICYYVVKYPGCSLKEIALSLNISLGSASQMVQAMTVIGLLQCTVNKDDRRRIAIKPTEILKDFFLSINL